MFEVAKLAILFAATQFRGVLNALESESLMGRRGSILVIKLFKLIKMCRTCLGIEIYSL